MLNSLEADIMLRSSLIVCLCSLCSDSRKLFELTWSSVSQGRRVLWSLWVRWVYSTGASARELATMPSTASTRVRPRLVLVMVTVS